VLSEPGNRLIILIAAAALSIERICYVWTWRHPESFRGFCDRAGLGEPVIALRRLFYCFKGIQLIVFIGWCLFYSDGFPLLYSRQMLSLATGVALIIVGQVLNFGVFYRLGTTGVFYGNKFGYEIPWCDQLPFSLFKHPQYVGALVSIWGFFLAMRFPSMDWFLLPSLETVYYALGAYLEQ